MSMEKKKWVMICKFRGADYLKPTNLTWAAFLDMLQLYLELRYPNSLHQDLAI